MNLVCYYGQKPLESHNPIQKIYRIAFSKFTSDEQDEEGNAIIKCFEQLVKGIPTTYDVIQIVKNTVVEYANSSYVKEVFIKTKDKDVKGWLDSDTRTSLVNTINAKKLAGETTIDIWFNDDSVTLTLDKAIELINTIELYSSNCYNIVQEKLNEINLLSSNDDIYNYVIVDSFPNKLIFNIED